MSQRWRERLACRMPGLHGETQIFKLTPPMKLRRAYALTARACGRGQVAIMRTGGLLRGRGDNGRICISWRCRAARNRRPWDGQLLGGAWRIKANALRQQEDGRGAPCTQMKRRSCMRRRSAWIPYHLGQTVAKERWRFGFGRRCRGC